MSMKLSENYNRNYVHHLGRCSDVVEDYISTEEGSIFIVSHVYGP